MSALHQFVPTFEPGATGAHMLEVQRVAREDLGVESEIFAEHIRGDYQRLTTPAHDFREYGRRYPARRDDVLVYQMAIGSDVADFVGERSEVLVVNHHNFTPIRLMQPWDDGVTWGVTWGERQLRELAARTELGIAVSSFNREALERTGYRNTAVAPIIADLDQLGSDIDAELEARLKEGKSGADWFFIGRVAPNKCQHDIVKAFAAYQRLYDPGARLWIAGSSATERYTAAVTSLIDELGLRAAVTLTGPLTQAQANAHFRAADVFVCLSEHEGFLVPILESWSHRLPVIAYAAAAVPETLGDGGLLLRDKRPATVAAAVDRVVRDHTLAAALVAQGDRRLRDNFTLDRTRARFAELVRPLL